MTIVLIAVGLVMLAVGGEMLVRGSVSAAKSLGVSPLLIGLTLVGFGTSTPELVTSLFAAFEGSPGIAIGNVVGSNIANILLILGVSALIMPLVIAPAAFRRDGIALLGSTFLCLTAVLVGYLSRWLGLAFVGVLIGYVAWAFYSESRAADLESEKHAHMAEDAPRGPRTVLLATGLAIVGIAVTVLGARVLVSAAIDLATAAGISETIIGLTIVAVGTSLPELVACGIAAWRGHSDVALGNIVGSNIYNVLGILGVTAVIHPISVPPEIVALDIWVLVAATGLLAVFLRTGWMLRRWEGGVLCSIYGGYLSWLLLMA